MKSKLLLFAALLISMNLFSQKIGVVGGVNFSNAKRTTELPGGNGLETLKTESVPGTRIGLALEYEYPSGVTVGAQGVFSQKGFFYTDYANEEVTESINYLDVPIYFGYTYTIDDKVQVIYNYFPIKLFLYVGLDFGIGLNGQNSTPISEKEIAFGNEPPSFGSDDIIYQKLNMQGIAMAGLIVGSLRLAAGYDLGLSNIETNPERELSFRTFHVSLGFVFDFKQKRW